MSCCLFEVVWRVVDEFTGAMLSLIQRWGQANQPRRLSLRLLRQLEKASIKKPRLLPYSLILSEEMKIYSRSWRTRKGNKRSASLELSSNSV